MQNENRNEQILLILKKNELLQTLGEEELNFIVSNSQIRQVKKGEYIIKEGEKGEEIFLIIKGRAEVIKKDQTTGEELIVSNLKTGDLIGEMAFIDQSPRSASVRASEDCELLILHPSKSDSLSHHAIHSISKQLSKKLRQINEITVRSLQTEVELERRRLETGRILIQMLILLSLWIFFVGEIHIISEKINKPVIISSSIILSLLLFFLFHIKTSPFPLSYYAITLKNWKKYALQGFVFTLPLLALTTLIKHIIFPEKPIIDLTALSAGKDLFILGCLVYFIFSIFQEFIVRGMLQTSISTALKSKTCFLPIILSNVVFADFHVHLSPIFALVAFIFGCFWGLFRHYQNSLVGSCVSHILIGAWGLIFLNLGPLITKH